MQDPFSMSVCPQINPPLHPHNSEENLKCPRCESTNTKFCYFNNYNLSQPRHYCKSCRRYWTKGGALRKVPVGGGSRKNNKRSSKSSQGNSTATQTASSSESEQRQEAAANHPFPTAPNSNSEGDNFSGYFGKLTQGSGNLGSLLGPRMDGFGLSAGDQNRCSLVLDNDNDNDDGVLSIHGCDADCWSGATGGWPDIDVYNPDSTFH